MLIPCTFLWLVAIQGNNKHLLLQHRADGLFGTPGGKVDAGEDIITALIREIDEEANIKGLVSDATDVLELGTFESNGYIVHSFVKEISVDYMRRIQQGYHQSSHSEEVAGMSILTLTPQTIPRLLKYPFAGSGNKEIRLVLDFLNLELVYPV